MTQEAPSWTAEAQQTQVVLLLNTCHYQIIHGMHVSVSVESNYRISSAKHLKLPAGLDVRDTGGGFAAASPLDGLAATAAGAGAAAFFETAGMVVQDDRLPLAQLLL